MAIVLMSLGPHKFFTPNPGYDTPGFETLVRDNVYTWIPQGRLNKPVAMQFTGPGEENFSIEGRLYPYHFGGISTLNNLRASAEQGQVLTLYRFYPIVNADAGVVNDPNQFDEQANQAGIGAHIVGQYGIRRVGQKEGRIGAAGMAHRIDFQLDLIAYGPDQVNDYNGVLYGGGQST